MSRTKGYKCFNIECGSCIGKTLCGEPEDTALGCAGRVVGKPMTNADRIRYMDAADVATVRHGRWVYPIGMAWNYVCSECGKSIGVIKHKYCPNCGAKMMEG